MTLWILFCRMTKEVDTLFPFYAKDREQAERRAEEILKEYRYETLELKEYPYGFKLAFTHIPGTMEGVHRIGTDLPLPGGHATSRVPRDEKPF